MKKVIKYIMLVAILGLTTACTSDNETTVANNLTLNFKNTFGDTEIVLGNQTTATLNTSAAGQQHYFTELKYVISSIRLVKEDGTEIPYHINDLDNGAMVVNQANPKSLQFVMKNIPAGNYTQVKFGLGVRSDLNTLDEKRFPQFYAQAGANNTQMMWEWGTGYRFTKIEGFYDTDSKPMSIHTGSTVEGEEGKYIQGVDAYRNIVLSLPVKAVVGKTVPTINIKADFDQLLSGAAYTIVLSSGTGANDNATPNVHTAVQMLKFVDNLGGNGTTNTSGMFSVLSVQN